MTHDVSPPPAIPIHDHVGLRVVDFTPGACEEVLDVPAWMREETGRPSLGALAFVADSAIGWAVASALDEGLAMVTAHLRFELTRPPTREDQFIGCIAEATHHDATTCFGRGDLRDSAGHRIGWATMRAAPMPLRGRQKSGAPVDALVGDGGAITVDCVDTAIDVQDLRRDVGSAELRVRCQPHLANSSLGVHGGVIALMGERGIRAAAASSVPDVETLRPVEFDVLYIRRLEADGSVVRVGAEVLHQTRRFLMVGARVETPDGETAALVRATYGAAS